MLPHLLNPPTKAPPPRAAALQADTSLPNWPTNSFRPPSEADPSGISKLSPVGADYPAGTGHGAVIEAFKYATAQRKPLTPGLANVYDASAWKSTGMLTPKTKQVSSVLGNAGVRPPMPNNGSILWSDVLRPFMPADPLSQMATGFAAAPMPFTVHDVGRGIRNFAGRLQWPSFLKGNPSLGAAAGALLGAGTLTGAAALSNMTNPDMQFETSVMPYLGGGLGALLGFNRSLQRN